MYLTISSVLTYCTLVSALAMLICFLLNQNKILCRIGSKCALILSLLLIGRMFLPFEFDFTYTLSIKWVIPYVREILIYELVGGKWPVSVWMIFVFIWGAGTAFCLVKKLSLYKGISQCIRLSKKEKVNRFLERKGLEKLESPEGERVQIIHMQGLHTPCIVGFRSACILFPDKVYSAEEVSLIIQHEMMHYKRKDILWKSVIDILCSFFWWNPVFCYLKKTVFRIVEIGDDTALTFTMSEREKIRYMECLINLAVDQRSSEIPFGVSKDRFFAVGVVGGILVAVVTLMSSLKILKKSPKELLSVQS